MAELRKIVSRPALSDFRQVTPSAGGAFRLLADAAETAYDMLAPAATKQLSDKSAEEWRQYARNQVGNPQTTTSTSGASRYRDAIASIESDGSGGYSAVGPTHPKMGRALGRYQVMEANIGPWSREVLGRAVSADEFMANPGIQDAIFDGKFGGYVQKYGEEGAAQAWFSGPGGVGKGDRKDVFGTTNAGYASRFSAALGTVTTSQQNETTTIRTKEGNLEPRLYSPMSGPMLQAANAAGGAAYLAETMLKGSSDIMGMSNEFDLNPEGFRQAADGYINQMVDGAPEPFKADLHAELTTEAQRRMLGMVEEQHRDTRQRAANATAALTDRWSGDYADAVAGGDPKEIAAAESRLRGVLRQRESLAGQSWTPEQSDNVIMDARDKAAAITQNRQAKVAAEQKSQLSTIIDAATNGLKSAYDSMLTDPNVAAANPELWREAVAQTAMRDVILPSLTSSPTAARKAAIADLEANPISEDYQVDIVKAARAADAAVTKAFDEDSIAAARTYLPEKPPEISPDNMESGLRHRRAYAAKLQAEGYTPDFVLLDDKEAETFGAMFAKDMPLEGKFAAATAIVAALGDEGFSNDAAAFFGEIKAPVTVQVAGTLMASGLNQTGVEILEGQARLDAGIATGPKGGAMMATYSEDAAKALFGLRLIDPDQARTTEANVMEAAQAIFASRAPRDTSEEAEAELMEQSIQAAMGQTTNRRRGLLGGVQKVAERPVWLPADVSGTEADAALEAGFGGAFNPAFPAGMQGAVDEALWKAAGMSSAPMLGGTPISGRSIEFATLTPMGGNMYRLSLDVAGQPVDVMTADGLPYDFDLKALIGATK